MDSTSPDTLNFTFTGDCWPLVSVGELLDLKKFQKGEIIRRVDAARTENERRIAERHAQGIYRHADGKRPIPECPGMYRVYEEIDTIAVWRDAKQPPIVTQWDHSVTPTEQAGELLKTGASLKPFIADRGTVVYQWAQTLPQTGRATSKDLYTEFQRRLGKDWCTHTFWGTSMKRQYKSRRHGPAMIYFDISLPPQRPVSTRPPPTAPVQMEDFKFFFAGEGTAGAEEHIENRLLSYYYLRDRNNRPKPHARECADKGWTMMLDSGAYSAHTQGETIDVNKYADFILADPDLWSYVASLDVIPGNGISVERAAAQSFENLQRLRELGCEVFPTYHYGEPIEYLKFYLAEYDFIALGGMVQPGKPEQMRAWLDWVWPHLTDSNDQPIVRVHGFGICNPRLVMRYPWVSTDGTSWLVGNNLSRVCEVWQNDRQVKIKIDHARLPPEVEDLLNLTTEACRKHYRARNAVNAYFFAELQRRRRERFLPHPSKGDGEVRIAA